MVAEGTVKMSAAMMMLRGEDMKIPGSIGGRIGITIIPLKMQADTGTDVALIVPEMVSIICLHFLENLMLSDLNFQPSQLIAPFQS